MNRLPVGSVGVRFQINGLPGDLFRVEGFSGVEAISTPFRYEVKLICDEQVEFESVIGRTAVFSIADESSERPVRGRVTRLAQVEHDVYTKFYQARLMPEIWRLAMRYNCRIFQKKTVQDIIKQVFQAAKIPASSYEFKLQKNREHEYYVQYRESDFNFISRLMEAEGISYFFDHSQNSVMIITDNDSVYSPLPSPTIPFAQRSGTVPHQEHVIKFQRSQQILASVVSLSDYNYEEPGPLFPNHRTSDDSDFEIEVYDYPGDFSDMETGGDFASMRLDAIRAQAQIGMGRSTVRRFAPGRKFTLAHHPRPDFNREYLITRTLVSSRPPGPDPVDDPYHNRFYCIPSSTPFRPQRVTPRPHIQTQTATVVGPSGEEIYTDGLGRIKIQFHWDRDGKRNEEASCWVRVTQALSGPRWGSLFIPRIRTEVVVEFVNGNPNEPLVTGCVYNGSTDLPYPLPAEKTKSTIKTNSSKGGGGFNEITFEDRKGEEQIFIHAQKDLSVVVENDSDRVVGNNKSVSVGNDHTHQVEQNETIQVGANRTIGVGGDQTLEIEGTQNVTIGANQSVDVNSGNTLHVGGANRTDVDGENTVRVGGSMTTTVQGSQTENVSRSKRVIVGDKIELTCGAGRITIDRSGKITIEGSTLELTASGPIKINGSLVDLN